MKEEGTLFGMLLAGLALGFLLCLVCWGIWGADQHALGFAQGQVTCMQGATK